MSKIKSIHINNFKFFDEQKPIELGNTGKHLLLYGENGSGKSSVYWALYTLFECALKKDKTEIEKYFKHADVDNESLINIHATKIPQEGNTPEHYNSFIKVTTTDNTPTIYEVSLLNTNIIGNNHAIEINQASDFINYKVLFKFQDFWNGLPIDLARIFEGYVLPYVQFTEYSLWRNGTLQPKTSAIEMWEEIKRGPGETKNRNGDTIQVYKYSKENKQFEQFAAHFDNRFKDLIEFINANAPAMLKKLGYDIEFELKYHEHTHKKRDTKYDCEIFKIDLIITSYLGKVVNIYRPQSFLNEAKITAIAIAIRLTILRKRINEQAPDVLKFIVFDDVMISLDMNNRDKFIDFILNNENKFTEDYQLLFLTHDKNLYDFVANKIKQWDKLENWVFKEMYAGKNGIVKKEFPIIIDSNLNLIDKAQKYYDAKDYTASSIYLRKELERIVVERLPVELKSKVNEKYIPLETLWDRMVERYNVLGKEITADIKKAFSESKLHILNPQAHFQSLSLPVYKNELDKVFQLIQDIEIAYPIPKKTLLINKESILVFSFVNITHNYTIRFELLTDFYSDEISGNVQIHYPKCKVLNWTYNGTDFWDFHKNQTVVLPRPLEFNKIQQLVLLIEKQPLGITKADFEVMTTIENNFWSLKDILDKANITL
jgi:energy-coupling factor transporter ATP-binding protein EcfA2